MLQKQNTRTRKRSWKLLFVSMLAFVGLVYLIWGVDPEQTVLVLSYPLSIFPLFFISLFLFLFGITSFLFKSKVHGILIAMIIVAYLLFRQNDLTHPFFAILLLALLLVLELMFTYRK